MLKTLTALLFISGCGVPYPTNMERGAPESFELALGAALETLENGTGHTFIYVPEVLWFVGACLEGVGGDSCTQGMHIEPVSGPPVIYMVDLAGIGSDVSWGPVGWVLCHELIHQLLLEKIGDGDSDHTDSLFSSGMDSVLEQCADSVWLATQ